MINGGATDRAQIIMTIEELHEATMQIFTQLGGKRFVENSGVNDFRFGDGNDKDVLLWVAMKIPPNQSGYNVLRIELNNKDLYSMQFYYRILDVQSGNYITVREKKYEDLYDVQLEITFQAVTAIKTKK